MSLRCRFLNWHKIDSESLRKSMEHFKPVYSFRKRLFFGVHEAFCMRCGVKIMGRVIMKNYDETTIHMTEKFIYSKAKRRRSR